MSSRTPLWRAALSIAAALTLALTGAAGVLPAASAPPAKAAPDAGVAAAHLLGQPVSWEPCAWPGLPWWVVGLLNTVPGTACASITVPRDWHHPADGNTIQLRVTRTTTAVDPGTREGVALVNPGGPGEPGAYFGPLMALQAPQLAAEYDFWGFDPRGFGESTPLACPSATAPRTQQEAVDACRNDPLAPYVTSEQTAWDMDFLRALAGETRVSYYGYSYGTWLGSWYQRLFPARAHRFVLDSALDLTRTSPEASRDLQFPARDRHFQEMMLPYVARNAARFGASSTDPLQLRRDWEAAGGTRTLLGRTIARTFLVPAMDNTLDYPIAALWIARYVAEGGGAPADEAGVRALFLRMADEVAASPALTPDRAARVLELAAGASVGDRPDLSGTPAWAVRCQDGPWRTSAGAGDAWLRDVQRKAPFIAPLATVAPCGSWPNVTQMPNRLSPKEAPPTLLLQAELDAATPYEGGVRSAQLLPGTALVSVDNQGSHTVFPSGIACVDDTVNAYLLDGVLPDRSSVCQAAPLPGESETVAVGGDLGPRGTIRLKLRTDDVKRANALLRDLLAGRGLTGA